MNKLDVVFIFVFVALVVSWNYSRQNEQYLDQLRAFARTQADDANVGIESSAGEGEGEGEGEGDGEGEGEGEGEGDEGGKELDPEAAEEERQKQIERETKKFLEIEKELEEQLKKDQDEQIVLNARLVFLRQRFKNGVLSVIKEQIAKEDAEDYVEEESEDGEPSVDFDTTLVGLVEKWTKNVDDIHRISLGKTKSTDTDELKVLAKQYVVWQRTELARAMQLEKTTNTNTLTGKLEDNPAWAWRLELLKKAKEGVSRRKAVLKVNRSVYFKTIQATEKRVSDSWKTKREVVVLGEKGYINRDINAYNQVFGKVGFAVKRKKPNPTTGESHMSSKVMAGGSWSVLLCLALNTAHCFTDSSMALTQRDQKINRLQGLRAVLWDKHNFCKTLSQGTKFQPEFMNYTFKCWLFPKENKAALAYAKDHPDQSYIVKPLTMGGGMGISVVDGEKGLHRVRFKTHIVQTYLANPNLINGFKWDMRTYCLVTSTYPMRIYFFNRGIVRFASKPYDPNAKKGGKKAQFLTNTSVNKHYVKKGNVTDITWSFKRLQEYWEGKNMSYDKLLNQMEIAISTVFLSAEHEWKHYFDEKKQTGTIKYCANCYQIMGVDLIVDSDLHPRVIEVNGQPSMALSKDSTDHYTQTKKAMITDMVKMVYNTKNMAGALDQNLRKLRDRSVLKKLTKMDWEYLIEYQKEVDSLGGWRQVYPSARHKDYHTRFLDLQEPTAQRKRLHDILVELEEIRQEEQEEDARARKAA